MIGASLVKAPDLLPNIRLGWEGSPGTNTLTYYEKVYLTAVKKFYNIGLNSGQGQMFKQEY
jgi:hypothetical protein